MRAWPVLVFGVFTAVGCVPSADGSETVQVVSYGPEGYSPASVDLALNSLQPLEMPEVRVFLGGSFAFRGAPTVLEAATPFDAQMERGVDGSLVPTDYLTVLAVCMLHHLDVSRRYIDALNVPGVQDVPPYEIYLHPQVSSSQLGNFTDNMAYVRGVNWFLVAPDVEIDALPLACNRSVVAHEFGHALSFHSDMTADRFVSGDIVAIDEGFADIIGAGVTNNAYGLRSSTLSAERDLNVARVDDPAAAAHERGAVLASLFWAYRGGLISITGDVAGATNDMVRLALETMLSFRGDTRPTLVAFAVRAVELSPEPEVLCQRAPLAFPDGAVASACASR